MSVTHFSCFAFDCFCSLFVPMFREANIFSIHWEDNNHRRWMQFQHYVGRRHFFSPRIAKFISFLFAIASTIHNIHNIHNATVNITFLRVWYIMPLGPWFASLRLKLNGVVDCGSACMRTCVGMIAQEMHLLNICREWIDSRGMFIYLTNCLFGILRVFILHYWWTRHHALNIFGLDIEPWHLYIFVSRQFLLKCLCLAGMERKFIMIRHDSQWNRVTAPTTNSNFARSACTKT